MEAEAQSHLRLDRRYANLGFASWRLNNSIVHSEGYIPSQAAAQPALASDTDYVTARHAALLNGITQQPGGGCYAFLLEGGGGGGGEAPAGSSSSPLEELTHEQQQQQLALYQVELGDSSRPPCLRRVCGECGQGSEGEMHCRLHEA